MRTALPFFVRIGAPFSSRAGLESHFLLILTCVTRSLTVPTNAGSEHSSVADMASSFLETLQNGEETAKATMLGSADPHALVQALAQTQLAVETAVTVRNKVVEAYQEILRMQV